MVVGHPGRGSMVDVQFADVDFVERREASRLAPSEDWEGTQKRAVVQGVYESLLLKRLGVRAFRDTKGVRADVKALRAGELEREDIDDLLSRAFAIATRKGQKQGDVVAGGAAATAAGRALSALRIGADSKLVKRQMKAAGMTEAAMERVLRLSKGRVPDETQQRIDDYEETLALRRKPVSRRTAAGAKKRPPVRRKNVAQGNMMPTAAVPLRNNVAQGNTAPTTYASSYGPPMTLSEYGVRVVDEKGVPLLSDTMNSGALHAVLGGLGSSDAEIARHIEEADRKGKSRRTHQGLGVEVTLKRIPVRRNYFGSALRGAVGLAGSVGAAASTIVRYGRTAATTTREFVRTPLGAQLTAAIIVFGTKVLGTKVMQSGVFRKKDVEAVQGAIASETGVALSQELIQTALEGAARA